MTSSDPSLTQEPVVQVTLPQEPVDSSPPSDSQEKMSSFFKEFSEKLQSLPTTEEKIAHGLQFMRSSISQEGSPRFRDFWEARRVVLPCFKENINPAIRSKLWGEYVELTVEARRLKEILEEQSAFAMEQIDLAIKALETEVMNFGTALTQNESRDISIQELSAHIERQSSQTIFQKQDIYKKIQRELSLLNHLASRLNGLRKEIIKTDMRIRFKTKFFKRLSDLGDRIFPKRKQLIEAISEEFQKDVDQFVANHFQGDTIVGAPYYAVREEIKSLQGIAKLLTLSSHAFTQTRLKLSECWDKVKILEKEYKKEVLEKKQVSSENSLSIQAKIDALKEKVSTLSLRDLDKEIDEISNEMRATSLHRDDVRRLRDACFALRTPFIEAQEQKARDLEEAEKEKLRLKKEKIISLKDQIAHLIKEGEKLELEAVVSQVQEIQQVLEKLDISKMERQQFDRMFRPLKDLVADKKERSLLNLSDDEKKTLENLNSILQQKKQRRQEIKDQLETYRKILGGSGLDFEKAMQYQELVEQERERLEKANAGIQEVEQKIAELEG